MAKIVPQYNEEYIVCVDVDETLVKMVDGQLRTHKAHINAIKMHWYRGHHVIVWSAGGKKWAEYIVKRLELNDFVHEIKAKPRWIYDDKPSNEWMERIYHYQEDFNNGCTAGSYEEVTRDLKTITNIPSITGNSDNFVYTVPEVKSSGINSGEESDESRSGAW